MHAAFVPAELIRKKRDGQELSESELSFLAKGFADGSVPDYQAAAWLMASYLRGMTASETFTLTRCVKESGRSLEWRKLSAQFKNARFADKHSTGGVGDKVSLILAPLAALLDVKVPMMSGRGLGHTGGTLDKLESISGFRVTLSEKEMIRNLEELGVVLIGQSADLCPADRKLYALRDVTATIDNVPLITASIVSKKWAEGVDAIVYDVKCGPAAFMDTLERARTLARSLVDASTRAGMRVRALLTRMAEPLGVMVGNALEVRECLWIMDNNYPSEDARHLSEPLKMLCCELAAQMAVLAGARRDLAATRVEALQRLEDGSVANLFDRICRAQGAAASWRETLPQAPHVQPLLASRSGVVSEIRGHELGLLGVRMQVGRARAEDRVDPVVGYELLANVGQRVEIGQPLMKVHSRNARDMAEYAAEFAQIFTITEAAEAVPSNLVMEVIE